MKKGFMIGAALLMAMAARGQYLVLDGARVKSGVVECAEAHLVLNGVHLEDETTEATETHIVFAGVEVKGKVDDFTDRMRDQGFKLQKKVGDERYYIYKGTYNGHSSYVRADYTPKSRTVYKVQVTPKHVSAVDYLDSLTVKYGKDYVSDQRGYQWSFGNGGVFFVTPEGKDPILLIMDARGAQLYKEESGK